MGLRISMVTPFAWSQPHPVNDHVVGAAAELRRRGHEVVVLAPSNRAADLAEGRRALRRLAGEGAPLPDLVALGPALPVTPRSRIGVSLGARANLALALATDRFDVVHAHDPGVPSLAYLALRHAHGLTVATFHSTERLSYPPGKRQREKLLARVDALTATSEPVLEAARVRFPGDYARLRLSQFVVVGLALLWLYFFRTDAFARVRNWLIAANVIGLVGYVVIPTAPPRMFPEEGFVDTLASSASLNHGSAFVELAANPYAAMPSLHAADALIVGFALASLVRTRWARLAWTLWPTWVWFAVMATGNHFWLDIAAGVGVAGLAATFLAWVEHRRDNLATAVSPARRW